MGLLGNHGLTNGKLLDSYEKSIKTPGGG
eukprot:SAG11_NODE_6069_length_1394_cov_10.461004_1_plen_28_part_10